VQAWTEAGLRYRHYLYRFAGAGPPFRVVSLGPLFELPAAAGPDPGPGPGTEGGFQYGHGLEVAGGEAIISYGVGDRTAAWVALPVGDALALTAGDVPAVAVHRLPPRALPGVAAGGSLFGALRAAEAALLRGDPPTAAAAAHAALERRLPLTSLAGGAVRRGGAAADGSPAAGLDEYAAAAHAARRRAVAAEVRDLARRRRARGGGGGGGRCPNLPTDGGSAATKAQCDAAAAAAEAAAEAEAEAEAAEAETEAETAEAEAALLAYPLLVMREEQVLVCCALYACCFRI
jgi:hypothetical protein